MTRRIIIPFSLLEFSEIFYCMRYQRWMRILLVNFLLVGIAGLVMRYKIVWSLPWVNQKNLLHAHSHFAFAGWVSLALYLAVSRCLFPNGVPRMINRLMLVQWVSSLGMLFTFPWMGYTGPSIFFSTITIFTGYAFTWVLWKHLGGLGEAGKWIKIGLVANVVSSLGTFVLAWLMQQPGLSQKWYVFSVYFFLHFQYNGWFFFTIIGLFIGTVPVTLGPEYIVARWRKQRILFSVALLPALFLSALWMNIPYFLWVAALVSAMIQMAALAYIFHALRSMRPNTSGIVSRLWVTALVALVTKIVLQFLSSLPGLSVFAFGYRPLVIAYLHLVLLGFVSLFLIGYFLQKGWLSEHWGVKSVWSAVIINEVILVIQGLSAIGYFAVPYANEMLLANTLFLVVGAGNIAWKCYR